MAQELYGQSETALKSTIIKLENKMNLPMRRRGVIMQKQNLSPSADDSTRGAAELWGNIIRNDGKSHHCKQTEHLIQGFRVRTD